MSFRAITFAFLVAASVEDACSKRQSPSLMQAKFAGEEQVAHASASVSANSSTEDASVQAVSIVAAWSNWSKHLFAGVSAAIIFKICCLLSNVLVHVSPYSQVQEWEANGSTGSADPGPYVTIAIGCWQWCTYGFAAWTISGNDSFVVLVYANCIGAFLGAYYTFAFSKFCCDPAMWSKLRRFLNIASVMVAAQTIVWVCLTHQQALFIHSCAAALCSFLTSMSLLACLPSTVRTGDASGLCGPLLLANLVGSIMWTYWGVIVSDVAIISTDAFSACASICCLFIKYRFGVKGAISFGASEGAIVDLGFSQQRYQRKKKALSESQLVVAKEEPQCDSSFGTPQPVAPTQ